MNYDTKLSVRFIPSGEVEKRSVRWVLKKHGEKQLVALSKGLVNTVIFHDNDYSEDVMPSLKEYAEQAEHLLNTNGKCPPQITCESCVHTYMGEDRNWCSNDKSITVAKRFLDEMGLSGQRTTVVQE